MSDVTPTTVSDAPEGDISDATPQGSDVKSDPDDTTAGDPKNHEAAKWRTKLRAAEAERDQLTERLTAQQRALIDWRSTNSVGGAVDPQLLDAAGINITELLDDNGQLDMTLVDQFIEDTATRFRVHRQVRPNPQQGMMSAARARDGLAELFDPNRRI